jgi:hypothetical protein
LGRSSLFDLHDSHQPLASGGIALAVEEGHLLANRVRVAPIGEPTRE